MTQAETIAKGAPKATASESKAVPKVELRDIGLRYYTRAGEIEALRGVSIDIAPGEFVSIVGPSGCGKSTLLSLIAGILKATSGSVLIDGSPVNGPSKSCGYMLQHDHLFGWRPQGRRHWFCAAASPSSLQCPHTTICVPTSITCSVGIMKYSDASLDLRESQMNR